MAGESGHWDLQIVRPLTNSFLAQVFIGRNFGAFVTFEEGKYIYFYIGQTGFCVYAA